MGNVESQSGDRGRQVLLNSAFGVLGSILSLGITYAVRVAVSRIMGGEIYGLNSACNSIVSAMLILELGISAAIVIFLYKPVAENDFQRIKSLMRFYRDVYRVFSATLLIVGVIVAVFFIEDLIHAKLDRWFIQLSFLLYLLAIVAKYIWGYKKTLLFASQRNRICSLVTALTDVAFGVVEIVILATTREYLLFLVLYIVQNLTANAICNIIVNKRFPFILGNDADSVDEGTRNSIIAIMKPLFTQRITNQINTTSSTVILSAISEVFIVGVFSNYMIIIHAIQALLMQVGNSFASSLGNYSAEGRSKNEQYDVYRRSRLGIFSASLICSAVFLASANPFIFLLFGREYVVSIQTLLLLMLHLVFILISSVDLSVQNAIGLHRLDYKAMIAQSVLTIVASVALGLPFGLNGILIANVIVYFAFTYFYKCLKLHLSYYDQGRTDCFKMLLCELIEIAIVSGLLLFLNSLLPEMVEAQVALVQIFTGGVVATIVSLGVLFALNYRSEHFKYYVCRFRAKLPKRNVE